MSNRVIIRQINVKSIGSQPVFSGNRDRTSETVGIADELLNIIRADRIAEDRFCVVVAQRTIESQECIKFNPTEMGKADRCSSGCNAEPDSVCFQAVQCFNCLFRKFFRPQSEQCTVNIKENDLNFSHKILLYYECYYFSLSL